MKTFIATIEGTTPMLQNRFDETAEVGDANSRKVHIRSEDPREVAERAAHRNAEGHLFFPGAAIARLLREAGAAHKQRGSRKSMRYVVPSAILVLEERIILRDSLGEPLTDFEVDSRSVVIPSTKGRIMRHRPRLNSWGCEFSLSIDDDQVDTNLAHQLLVEGGSKIGLGDFRPEKGGPFGRFHVVSWAELKAVKPAAKMKSVPVAA